LLGWLKLKLKSGDCRVANNFNPELYFFKCRQSYARAFNAHRLIRHAVAGGIRKNGRPRGFLVFFVFANNLSRACQRFRKDTDANQLLFNTGVPAVKDKGFQHARLPAISAC